MDDIESSRTVVCAGLRAKGFLAQPATDGRETLWRRARTQNCEVVITDVDMPQMDGIQYMKKLRRMPGYGDIPVFVLPSDASSTRYGEGIAAGATGWLVKPVNLEALAECVAGTLREPSERKAIPSA